LRISLSADPIGFPLVDYRYCLSLNRTSNCCGFTVVEGSRSTPNHKFLKPLSTPIAEVRHGYKPDSDKFTKESSVSPAPSLS
jgi:hypothetical protein